MSPSLRYAVTGTGVVSVVLLGLSPFLDPASRRAMLLAATIAVPIQILAFWALVRFRDRSNGFLAAWAGGVLGRMMVVALAAFVVVRAEMEGAVPLLLGLVGFLFGLLLLEPLYFRASTAETG